MRVYSLMTAETSKKVKPTGGWGHPTGAQEPLGHCIIGTALPQARRQVNIQAHEPYNTASGEHILSIIPQIQRISMKSRKTTECWQQALPPRAGEQRAVSHKALAIKITLLYPRLSGIHHFFDKQPFTPGKNQELTSCRNYYSLRAMDFFFFFVFFPAWIGDRCN